MNPFRKDPKSRSGRRPVRGRRAVDRSVRSEPWFSAGSFEESFRILRSNLVVSLSELERPVVMVTSTGPHEGKTVVATKLAQACASARQRVVLVDLDFRHPSVHAVLHTHNDFGASDVLLGRRSLQESLQRIDLEDPNGWQPRSFYLLSAGSAVANPTEVLGSGRTARLLDALARQAEIVLVDTPPALPVADTLVVGRATSGAILVVETRITPFPSIEQAKNLLIRNQVRLLGVVMNKFESRDADLAHGNFSYGYYDERLLAPEPHPNGPGAPVPPVDGPAADEVGGNGLVRS